MRVEPRVQNSSLAGGGFFIFWLCFRADVLVRMPAKSSLVQAARVTA
ncbi:hypothetical protein AB434_3772 [Heyndrickxia coagulans]|uniref:Uncharacterized protein n=1 Tax=Heyndrickxia coagulans TaxID=1398 RepID=A0A0C5C1Y6_HEYCO|nr:hypothetical protein SB48_HM08orf02358 [Heyndrickxia coagulans]AKN56177.1 hypothetical protein AB434_3772 [Heyndrickxia coagulans]KWZ84682.1 hypothetical protein HMPREF3213_00772 [Heyndrickxia coagulans]KYC66473.1 hypothetical protein B4100_2800 [Heyndrickxia coagulans]KYC91992.1 hypothetical protein B4096_2948 [Heyndrickxia coagulans]